MQKMNKELASDLKCSLRYTKGVRVDTKSSNGLLLCKKTVLVDTKPFSVAA
jgi:hypothetical protein